MLQSSTMTIVHLDTLRLQLNTHCVSRQLHDLDVNDTGETLKLEEKTDSKTNLMHESH